MRTRRVPLYSRILCLSILVLFLVAFVGIGTNLLTAAENEGNSPGTYDGYLFSKLDNIGTRSEGPSYCLQLWDYREIHIIKNGMPWQADPKLHPLLDTKVRVTGTLHDGELWYTDVVPFKEY